MPSSRITLQHFELRLSLLETIPQFDACMRGTGTPHPSTIILDYMYGVAAYRRWGSGQEIKKLMQQRFTESYKAIPIPPAPPYISDDDGMYPESDDSKDLSYSPVEKKQQRKKHSDTSPEMLQAMDDIHALSMLLKGTTPELLAAERQRRAEVEELRAKEASKVKVRQWMQDSESPFVPYFWTISNQKLIFSNSDYDFQSNAATHYPGSESNAANDNLGTKWLQRQRERFS
jgi:hypothetical protein